MHRFAHLGDLHLGPNDRNADRMAAFDQAIEECLRAPLAAWLLPGDANHGRMTIPDKNYLADRTQRMANHAPVVWCYGNHDLPGDLDFLARLSAKFPIYVVSRPQVLRVRTATDIDAAIFVLPYPTRAGLVAAGVSSDHVVSAAREALDILFMHAASQLDEARAAGALTLMIGHVNVAGSIVSSGQPNIGQEIEIDLGLLDRLGPIYKGLNHIHKAQEVCGARYPGSLCRLDWGEVDPKGYLTIDMSADHELRPYILWHPLDVAPMFHIEGDLTRERFAWSVDGKCILDGSGPESFVGADVRVRFRFNAAEKDLLDFELVKAPFAGARRLELDPIAERTRAVRAPEVALAQSVSEKVKAFVRQAGLPWSPSLETKFALLEGPDGGAFLTEVERTLDDVPTTEEEPVCQ